MSVEHLRCRRDEAGVLRSERIGEDGDRGFAHLGMRAERLDGVLANAQVLAVGEGPEGGQAIARERTANE